MAPRTRSQRHYDLLDDGAAVALQTDGYAVDASWASKLPCIVLIACWAHARRKFREAFDAGQVLAAAPLQLIQQIYRIEDGLRENGSGVDECRLVRQAQAALILDRFKTEILTLRKHPGVLPKSSLGKAIDDTLALWDRLLVYLGDGSIEIDNIGIENIIRPTAVGKKNWLFVGGEDTGRRSAILYTLIENARRCGLDPEAYLTDVFKRLPTMTTRDDLGELLPSRWQAPGKTQERDHSA
jgi:transposase